jgi:hypothetical protein
LQHSASLCHDTPFREKKVETTSLHNSAFSGRCFWGRAFGAGMADTTVNLDDEKRQTGKTVFVGSDFTDLTIQQIDDAKETILDLETYWRRFRFEIDSLKENHRGEVHAFTIIQTLFDSISRG